LKLKEFGIWVKIVGSTIRAGSCLSFVERIKRHILVSGRLFSTAEVTTRYGI
jgi:hypothetical protein